MLKFKLFYESFENPSDLFLNPNFKNKSLDEILDDFSKSGGKVIGIGSCGTVLYHPSWKYVIKIFNDEFYLRFARFVYKNPHPSFPKIYGPPQRIVPFYKRMNSSETVYIARIELLHPIEDQELVKIIDNNIMGAHSYFLAKKYGNENAEFEKQVRVGRGVNAKWEIVKEKIHEREIELFNKYPKLYSLFEAAYIIQTSSLKGNFDLNKNNYMQRNDGTLVLIDPLWAGSNPYIDALMNHRIETDYYGGFGSDEEQSWDLKGGELKKRKKKFKPKTNKPIVKNYDDTPF